MLLSALRRAGGAPVSYAELRDAGIEFPASVVSELELAGVPVRRSHAGAGGGKGVVGVRLDPADDPDREHPEPPVADRPGREDSGSAIADRRGREDSGSAVADRSTEPKSSDPSGWGGVRVYRASTAGTVVLSALDWFSRAGDKGWRAVRSPRAALPTASVGRWVAPLALLATIAVVSAFVLIGPTGGGSPTRRSVAHRPPSRALAATGHSRAVTPAQPAARTPVSPVLATDLETRGHGLLQVGRYGDAVAVLRRAVLATGERISACLEPDSSSCLTYAYALYDLGRALRLSGDAAAAVPILERRLRIDNQRAVVQAELQLARQGIS